MPVRTRTITRRIAATIALVLLTIVVVWAIRGKLTYAQVKNGEEKDNWTVVNTDPWEELNTITTHMFELMPFEQDGKAVLKDSNDSLVEARDFHISYFDNTTMTYRVDQLEMVQTKNWQAMIDNEKKIVAVNGLAKKSAAAMQMGFDITLLKKIFNDNGFTLQVLHNGKGKRMLYSENFVNGTLAGLKIHYDATSHVIESVTMGIPKIVAKTAEEDRNDTAQHSLGLSLVKESLQLQYSPIQPDKTISNITDPNSYFTIKNKKLMVTDKRFDSYRIINHIK